ncbi:8449_t:CDS:2 [Diversispora eburnea]|uniref:8449_t:CDS:1 n=1 Tax=Diversispora eburnea TaxID=1213867 RepID=A0A9N9FSN1_9GLOM|nr:8449_t:CDS:2 [Diversispora eburnea]
MSELSRQSAFSYPSPATKIPRSDISLREILENYRDDNDLLKQILAAKAEEDKRHAEEEKYKVETVRLQCKQVELEMLKEQKKPHTIFTGVPRK